MEASAIIPVLETKKHKLNTTMLPTDRVTSQKTSVEATPRSNQKNTNSSVLSQTMRIAGSSTLRSASSVDLNATTSNLNSRSLSQTVRVSKIKKYKKNYI